MMWYAQWGSGIAARNIINPDHAFVIAIDAPPPEAEPVEDAGLDEDPAPGSSCAPPTLSSSGALALVMPS